MASGADESLDIFPHPIWLPRPIDKDYDLWLGPVTIGSAGSVENSQCRLNGSGSGLSGVGNNLTFTIPVTFKPGYSGSMQIYQYADDVGGLVSGWVQTGTWTVPAGDTTPPTLSNLQHSPSSTSATVSWNTNENADTQIYYGLTPSYGSQTALDSTMVLAHGQTITGLQPSTTYYYQARSRDAALNIGTATGWFTTAAGTQYYLTNVVSPAGAGTISPASGWYESGAVVWVSASANPGYQFSGFSGDLTGTTTPQPLTMNGPKTVTANFAAQPQYYLTTAVSPVGGGTISPASGWYNSGTPVTITATPYSGYQFSGFTGTVNSASNPLTVTMNSAMTETANFVATGQYTATTIADLNNCIKNLTQYTTCALAPSPNPYYVTAPIEINRSNVVVRGGSNGMNDTKLVRDPSYTGDLIRIGPGVSVSGVGLKYLTVCGGSNITPNGAPAPPSPVDCPRVQTVCGDRTRYATEHPGEPGQLPQCVDIRVVRSALPVFPWDPFNSPPGSYAVEFDHVDLEDATGHALSLRGASGNHVDDIYFHDGAINYSGVTGILMGVDGVDYSRKFCDGYFDQVFGFANDQYVFTPRNIRVEYSQFTENRTGVTGGIGRWIGFRNNTFTRNYIWPQAQGCAVPGTNPPVGDPNECWGGTLEFDACADQIQVTNNNTFTGPGSAHRNTQALEMYGRNITVDGNSFSGYEIQGIVANSLKQAAIRNNTITFSAPSVPEDGGITVSTVGAGGACTDKPLNIYRESKDISISGNTIWGQHYGVNLAEHPYRSTGAIHNLSIGTNYGNWSTAQYWQNAFVWANVYNGYSGPPTTPGPQQLDPPGVTPRVLPVDAESSTTRALCSLPGAARGLFTFAASDDSNGSANLGDLQPRLDYGAPGYAGAAQILYVEGVFSNAGPPGGPSNTSQDCHFYYAADANVVYLDDGTGTWGPGSSPVGAGGHDLTNPNGCIIHAASSFASDIQPGQYARSVTLDVEFLGSSGTKYVYAYTMNKNGIVSYAQYDQYSPVIWQHWGWWQKP